MTADQTPVERAATALAEHPGWTSEVDDVRSTEGTTYWRHRCSGRTCLELLPRGGFADNNHRTHVAQALAAAGLLLTEGLLTDAATEREWVCPDCEGVFTERDMQGMVRSTPPAATVTEADETGYRVTVDATTGAVSVGPWSPATVTEGERAARIAEATWEWGWHEQGPDPDGDEVIAGWGAHMGQMLYRLPRDGQTRDMQRSIAWMLTDLASLTAERDEALARLAAAAKCAQYPTGHTPGVLPDHCEGCAALTPSPAPDTDGGDS